MYTTTDLYKRLIRQPGRRQMIGGTITVGQPGTIIDLTPRNVSEGGLVESSTATSQQGAFTLGGAVVGEANLALINHEKQFENADFTESVLRPSMGLLTQQKWDGTQTIERVPLGVYTVDDADETRLNSDYLGAGQYRRNSSVPIAIAIFTYPATLKQIVSDACAVCGCSTGNTRFPRLGLHRGAKAR